MLQDILPYLPIVIVLLLMVRRTQKPRIIRLERIWIVPAVVLVLIAWYAYGAYRTGPHLSFNDDLIIAGSFVVGIVVGVIRAKAMRIERHPDTGQIEARLTVWGLGFVVIWILGRSLLRKFGHVDAATPFGVFTDSTVALAAGAIIARTFVVRQRCLALGPHHKPDPAAPTESAS
jgi:Zn-dependent protease